jgi:hypothetical protein
LIKPLLGFLPRYTSQQTQSLSSRADHTAFNYSLYKKPNRLLVDPFNSMTSQFSPVDAPNAQGDDRPSQSPSDDASNEGDSNQTLTSQTLNADGTPKRPMNAFMIFARRRRPQVSSENQSMRTGEISKILSKEWNSMPASEKQFYLDRAKELKEAFNSRYPDYVYRRRPNHSRRKRKNDGVHNVDGSGIPDSVPDNGMPRQPYDEHHPGSMHHRPSGMPSYGPSDPYGRDSSSRHSYDRHPPPNMNGGSPRLPGQSNSIPALHSYLSSQNLPPAGHSQHMYGSSSSQSNHSWDHPRLDTKLGNDGRLDSSHGRSSSNGWHVPPERSSSRGGGYPGQSGSPTGSAPNSATTGPGAGSDGNYNFPTLNSPFFPTPSQMFNSNSNSPSSSAGGSSAGGGGGGGGGVGSGVILPPPVVNRNGYDHRSYAPSPPPSLNGNSFAQSASRHSIGGGGLGGLNGLNSGNAGMPRSLPPVQSIPGYQSGLGPASGPPPPEMGELWTRGS